jgi:hypothetical protein
MGTTTALLVLALLATAKGAAAGESGDTAAEVRGAAVAGGEVPHVALKTGQRVPLVGMGSAFVTCLAPGRRPAPPPPAAIDPHRDPRDPLPQPAPAPSGDGEGVACTADYAFADEGGATEARFGAGLYYRALKEGARLFHVAPAYGSERPLGEALRRAFAEGWLARNDVFLAGTLPGPGDASWPELPPEQAAAAAGRPRELPRHWALTELMRSLRRLGVAKLDLLFAPGLDLLPPAQQLHFALWRQMEALVDAELVGGLGVDTESVLVDGEGNCERAGLCADCAFFRSMRRKPVVLFAECLGSAAPFSPATAALWGAEGMVMMGGGARPEHWDELLGARPPFKVEGGWVRGLAPRLDRAMDLLEQMERATSAHRDERGTPGLVDGREGRDNHDHRANILRWKAQFGSWAGGAGPVLFQSAHKRHLRDNLGVFRRPLGMDADATKELLALLRPSQRTGAAACAAQAKLQLQLQQQNDEDQADHHEL